ncbi:hypothetical protein AHF37_12086 [Paragonimus kellicotti]|nr:hypothetical protein AHF37_12086 [Paragonimus kellicotti]
MKRLQVGIHPPLKRHPSKKQQRRTPQPAAIPTRRKPAQNAETANHGTIPREYQLSELTDDSVRYLHQWPTLKLEFQQQSSTSPKNPEQFVISPHQCTMESCLNWKRCPLGSFLKFCLAESTLSEDPLERTLQHTLNIFVSLLLIPDSQTVTDLYQKLSDFPSLPRLIFAAPAYPQNFFRPHFDFIFPAKLYDLFGDLQHPFRNLDFPLIPGRRSILLATSVGRLKSGPVGRFAQLDAIFVEQLLKFSNASHYPQLADLFQLHLYQTNSESLMCWPNRFRMTYPNHRFSDFEWFPMSKRDLCKLLHIGIAVL